jgi:hypothetical protein
MENVEYGGWGLGCAKLVGLWYPDAFWPCEDTSGSWVPIEEIPRYADSDSVLIVGSDILYG